ncbi:MAG: hypothetical protein K5636_06640 [Bacteroidales bacterium]|nr:hypothetical protein [Bacteroidales bacterium]
MKRLLSTICLLAICFGLTQAQTKVDSEKMIKERVENMRANLKLSSAEAKAFYPAYEQFLRNEIKCHETYKQNLAKKGIKLNAPGQNKEIIESLKDDQLSYLQDQKFELRKSILNMETSFYKKLKTMLTPRHIQNFYNIDDKYKRQIIAKRQSEKSEKKAIDPSSVNSGKKRR